MTLSPFMSDAFLIQKVTKKILSGGNIMLPEAKQLLNSKDISTLTECANTITRVFNGDSVDVETLINAKSGNCPEDCSFCSQSIFYDTGINKYELLSKDTIVKQAQKAKENGSSSFCLVCAYRSPPEKDFQKICEIIMAIKADIDIDVNVSLGFLTRERARRLKEVGVRRYNHNLETSESYFSQICRTHDFADRVNTAKIAKEEGMELCCGGIIGMGENPEQRLLLAFSIASLHPEEVPINILIARDGTPLANSTPLDPLECIKTIAVWRFIIPRAILKIAGGREVHLMNKERLALKAGANGIITGGYLTTGGNSSDQDIAMIRDIGLKIRLC
jgi:biotin synthase